MRLRNKKTGEVADFKIIADYDDCTSGWRLEKQDGSVLFYDYIDEIKEEWEDYKPAEPLIKDEKIRKAVRAWAELIPSAQVRYDHSDGRFYTHSDYIVPYSISFPVILGLDETTDYTIAELCGEEEE